MSYSFELLGVTPILEFFNHQQRLLAQPSQTRLEYIGARRCSLDRFLQQLQDLPPDRNWDPEALAQVAIDYWIGRAPTIQFWTQRLADAGSSCLVVARIGDFNSLRHEFEHLFTH
ncbi:hypothetical protein [Synechococcus sp. PCC 7336]|uniref:hypothetical protein n=1 Tax=Synechococcus sp. PCC 7336 TaxID=195250 RepID=UPI00034645B4|nr:hypothetical protein [Synechococcus sp. PCC 7336]